MIYLTLFIIVFSIGFTAMQLARFAFRKPKKEVPKEKNPYIEYHIQKMKNDKNYEDYLKWMTNKEVHGAPVNKVEAPEDKRAKSIISRLFPRRKFTDDEYRKMF